jgi:hypothetical protein
MLGRYILISLGIIAVVWTAYVSIDLIDKKDELSPMQLFGVEDKELLVIHRAEEFDWNAVPFKTTLINKNFLDQLGQFPESINSLFISSSRSHLLFESSEFWSRKKINKLFESFDEKPKFDGVQSFQIKEFQGKIYRNRLYLFSKELNTTAAEENWLILDKKASASMVRFESKGFLLTDIYLKSGGRVDYITRKDKSLKGKQIMDKELFAHVLPVDIDDYHFFEREFLGSNDQTFRNSPMFDWVDKGLVLFTVDGKQAVISDFKTSQDPVNSLFDFTKKDPENLPYGYFQNLELMEGFPEAPSKGFYAYNMDDYVVMSQDQDLCEQIVANYRLGNTLSQHPEKTDRIFGKLPARVSERHTGSEINFTRSVYNGQLFQTVIPQNKYVANTEEPNVKEGYKTFKLGGKIHDFYVQSGEGNFLAITKSGLLRAYKNGSRAWEKKLNGEPIGEIALVKWKDMPHWLITTKNGVYLFDEQGVIQNGFPAVAADRQLVAPAMTYSWKGRYWVLAVNSSGDIIQLDQVGRRHATIKSGLSSVSASVDVWVSQRRVYYGIRNDETFKMFDAENKREYRSFVVPQNSISIKTNNEVVFYAISGDQLVSVDQKGNRTNLGGGWQEYQLSAVNNSEGKTWLTLFSSNSIKLVDNNGKTWHSLSSNSQNIEAVFVEFLSGGKTTISVVDGLENDVYLYGLNGQMLGNSSFEGSFKGFTSTQATGLKLLTTVVDDFIVQHTIK